MPADLPRTETQIRFAINLAAMLALVFGLYWRRYRDKETAASMFNVFVFAVLTVLSSVEFSMTAGFGRFAILAQFTLRSEQISKTEIPCFFGAIAIAVICPVPGTPPAFAGAIAATAVVCAAHSDVRGIDGQRAFAYATRNFDNSARRAGFDHHQGRRKRCKVGVASAKARCPKYCVAMAALGEVSRYNRLFPRCAG